MTSITKSTGNKTNTTGISTKLQDNINFDEKKFAVSEPWFSYIQNGIKTVEGRLSKEKFAEIKTGDIITWTNTELTDKDGKQIIREIKTQVTGVSYYPDFEKYLNGERIKNCLPNIRTIKEGLAIYYKFYPREERQKYKVIAIRLALLV